MSRKKAETQENILAAALKVFARDGFDGASLPRIASLAGVAHPLILYHFESKDNLWRRTVEHAFGPLIEQAAMLETNARDFQPLKKLRVMVKAFTYFAARHPEHFALIMSEAPTGSDRLQWLREHFTDAFLLQLQEILRQAQVLKQIRDIPVEHLSFILIGSVLLYFSLNFYLPEDADLDVLADQHAEYVLTVLLDGVRA